MRTIQVIFARVALVGSTLVIVSGCGDRNLVPVSGTVQREGELITAGRIMFRPLGEGRPAFGNIRSDGTFLVMTERPGDGAPVGEYHVMIVGALGPTDNERRTNYRAPSDRPVKIVAGQANEFDFAISKRDGWQIVPED